MMSANFALLVCISVAAVVADVELKVVNDSLHIVGVSGLQLGDDDTNRVH